MNPGIRQQPARLNGRRVATGSTDGAGATTVSFVVPAGARTGRHLVTVGVEGTGLTADCTVEVPEQRTRYEYPAKLVCGVQPDTRTMRLARGFYATTINVRNPQDYPVELTKTLALTVPPGFEKPGELLPIAKDVLQPGYALAVDCDEIRRRVFQGSLPSSYIEGFVAIQSSASLDVTAVYSTATLNAEGTAEDQAGIHIEPVPERIVRAVAPRERADLVVRDIDLASLDVDCPKGGDSCVTSVRVTIANIGTGDSGSFDTISVFDPDQSVTVGTPTPGGLAAGASRAFPVKTPPGGNCFDPNCTICVTVDSAAAVAESDETNNQLCRTKDG